MFHSKAQYTANLSWSHICSHTNHMGSSAVVYYHDKVDTAFGITQQNFSANKRLGKLGVNGPAETR
jgi:hypothetical protein